MASVLTAAAKRYFRIQYVSDIHLEFYDKATFPLLVKPAARYLALAGDIGQPHKAAFPSFIDYVSRHWDEVFYITGNHEYYNKDFRKWKYTPPKTIATIDAEIAEIVSKHKNVHFLNPANPSYFLAKENVAIVGATLWSHVPPELKYRAESGVNDYNCIYAGDPDNKPVTTETLNAIHTEHKRMLESQIDFWTYQKVPVVVMTHHMPSFRLVSPRWTTHPLNVCFASNCDSLMRSPVKAWIYGHTHNVSSGMLRNVFTAVNARGYPSESLPGFSTEAYIEFPVELDDSDKPLPELAKAATEELEFM